jgi:hypothetical protein
MPRGGNHGGGRPALPPDQKKIKVICYLDPTIAQRLDAQAQELGYKSRSQLLGELLAGWLKHQKRLGLINGLHVAQSAHPAYLPSNDLATNLATELIANGVILPE